MPGHGPKNNKVSLRITQSAKELCSRWLIVRAIAVLDIYTATLVVSLVASTPGMTEWQRNQSYFVLKPFGHFGLMAETFLIIFPLTQVIDVFDLLPLVIEDLTYDIGTNSGVFDGTTEPHLRL